MEPLKKILLRLRNVFTKKDDSVIPTDFSDLAPLDSIDNTSEYLNALDWALKIDGFEMLLFVVLTVQVKVALLIHI